MSNVLKENYKKLVDALAPYFGGASDFDDLTNRPQESDTIDISELDLPMPAKPTEYPVLFDETGTEYQVGLYKRASDGKVKPVWRKDYVFTLSSTTTNWVQPVTDNTIDKIVKFNVWGTRDTGTVNEIEYSLLADSSSWTVQGAFYIYYNVPDKQIVFAHRGSIGARGEVRFSVYLTRTTDEWKEV